ncbi:hypothetical protein MES5069_450051 [Mesorhizobium escarrei]|uniref:Uncharacterized protein n=1 Tax=Mesorhizobium escarrei TaxID=666018 RepID=A0ABM9E7K7_9HYPH|nr:hypothetical protein MES5069_450051 [Mesorhizobium escarrei]
MLAKCPMQVADGGDAAADEPVISHIGGLPIGPVRVRTVLQSLRVGCRECASDSVANPRAAR